MDIPVNTFKRALREHRPQIGLWCSLCSAYTTEIVAGSGFDWLLIDTEHSPNDLQEVMAQLQAIAAGAAGLPSAPHAIVRPAWNDMVLLKRYLDIGAQSFLVPYVQTEEEARNAVAWTRYPPQGVRGVGGTTRATRFGRVKDYFKRVSEEICVLVQIETRKGLENLEKIAAVDGVDGIFIGPADLSAGLGHVGNIGHPEAQRAIDDAIARVVKTGKAPGMITMDEAAARRYLEAGCLFVAVGQDIITLARETEKIAAKFKS
jgi:4-hydroxy-2-oxoheptanedioate aldolase